MDPINVKIWFLPIATHHRLLPFISQSIHHFFGYAFAARVRVAFVAMVAENLRWLHSYIGRTATADRISIANDWYEDEFMAANAAAV